MKPSDRLILAHPAIKNNLLEWIKDRKDPNAISNQFSVSKQQLGFGKDKCFHIFKRVISIKLENLECSENIASDIVRHKNKTTTYGLYSGDSGLEIMEKYLFEVSY
jgi:hypothetical protein